MASNKFLIAQGTSVVVIRDGKRVTINAGGGEKFTDAEVRAVRRAVPGALRAPVNESRVSPLDEDEIDESQDATDGDEKPATKPAKAKAAKTAKPAKAKAETPATDDSDEDEDI